MYSFAIIGAGQIASGYDNPGDRHVLTHAHAITLHTRASLLGFYDTDLEAATRAANKWGGKIFSNMKAMETESPDVVIICTPDNTHLAVLGDLLNCPPALVICEKPLTTDYLSSLDMVEAYRKKGVCLAINYQRRFDPVVTELKRKIDAGDFGSLLGGTIHYSKGLMHNGSHAIDLLRFLLGEVEGYLSVKKTFDFTSVDPSVSGFVRFERGDIALITGDERVYSIFEIDLLFEKVRYRFSHSGMDIEIQKPVSDDVYPGYFELLTEGTHKTGFTNTLSYLLDECVNYLSTGTPIRNHASTALGTQRLCEQMTKDDATLLTVLGV